MTLLYTICGIVGLAVWVWALIELIQNWGRLPTWAKVLGIVGLFFTGGIMTLLVVYLT
jgi:hypothetical protein